MSDKIKVKLQDISFYGDRSSSKLGSNHISIQWDRSFGFGSIVFFTDLALPLADQEIYNDSFRVAWLIEPSAINSFAYQYLQQNHSRFHVVLTHDVKFAESIPNGKFCPNLMSWINEEDWKLYDKSKNISIIASEKCSTAGHQIRHFVIRNQLNTNKIETYGNAVGRPIENKIDSLKDFRFQIAIENCQIADYFSEKLLDCFLTNTIPIYWGCPKIEKYFNPDGILYCEKHDNIIRYINDMAENGEEVWLKAEKARIENFNIAKQFSNTENWIYHNILKDKGLHE